MAGSPLPMASQDWPAVHRAVDATPAVGRAAVGVGDERDHIGGVGLLGVGYDRKTEVRGNAPLLAGTADRHPVVAGVLGPVHAPMVLCPEHVGIHGVHGQLVHALAVVRVVLGKEPRLDPLVTSRPGLSVVVGAVHAASRDGDDDPVGSLPGA